MRFKYEATFEEGDPISGIVDADDLFDAIDKIDKLSISLQGSTKLTISAVETVEIERGVLMDLVSFLDGLKSYVPIRRRGRRA